MYGTGEMQSQSSMSGASFEDLQRRTVVGKTGRSIDMDIKERYYEVRVGRIYLLAVSPSSFVRLDSVMYSMAGNALE